MSMGKVLIVDDDQNICELLRLYIEKEGYDTRIANDGKAALEVFDEYNPDLIMLDIMLPELDGWQVCREIRKKSQCPIIMLTAKSEVFDKVLGLELGADDYVVKPFEAKEIVARIKAVLRRSGTNDEDAVKEVHYDKLSINLTNYELRVNGVQVDTPPKEMELIYHLASNPNRVFSRDELLDQVWGFDYYGDSRTVDVHVKRLREKLEGVSDQWELKTVWGVGYKFELKQCRSNRALFPEVQGGAYPGEKNTISEIFKNHLADYFGQLSLLGQRYGGVCVPLLEYGAAGAAAAKCPRCFKHCGDQLAQRGQKHLYH